MKQSYSLIFYTGIPHSGVTFLFSVLEKNPFISTIMLSDDFFEYLTKKYSVGHTRQNGIAIYENIIGKLSENTDQSFDINKVRDVIREFGEFVCEYPDFFDNFCSLTIGKSSITLHDAVVTAFKAKMLSSGKPVDDNTPLAFFFDSHSRFGAALKHKKIIDSFENPKFLTAMRNPLYTTASSIKKGYYINKSVTYNLMKSSFLSALQKYPVEWKNNSHVILFEDEKLFPEKTFRSLCQTFSVPYDEIMLTANEEGPTSRGYAIRGFDTEPVTRKLDDIFSENDMKYLYCIFRRIMDKYGYPNIYPDINYCEDSDKLFNKVYEKDLICYSKEEFLSALSELKGFSSELSDNHFLPDKIGAVDQNEA